MRYKNITKAKFIDRPNRFIAHVEIDNKIETVHVKNTGRCKEILTPGATVFLEKSNNPNRKTKFSLVSAYKGDTLINIDSQIPNYVVYDAVKQNKLNLIDNITTLKREVTYNNSRFDLYFESPDKKAFMEVKGATLEVDGVSMFPDAPTKRGVKHVYEMIDAVKEGYEGYIFFLIQMEGVKYFKPNYKMDEEFSIALAKAKKKGVNILAYDCIVNKYEIKLNKKIPVVI